MATSPAGLDPRVPVLIGVGQSQRRPEDARDSTDPVGFTADVLSEAARDAGPGGPVLSGIESLRCVRPWSWASEGDPAAAVAGRIGITPRETALAHTGGDTPQLMLTDACREIRRGALDCAAVVGSEIGLTASGVHSDGRPEGASLSGQPDRFFGTDRPGFSELERDRGLMLPVHVYALLEKALCMRDGLAPWQGRERAAWLWAGLSEIAADNPHAWLPRRHSCVELSTPGAANRLISTPYPKLLTANLRVEQAAAVIVCSASAAAAMGVPRDRWVFPVAAAHGHDVWHVSERPDLTSSPVLRRMAGLLRPLLEETATEGDPHVDLYSCFPSALRIGAESFGLLDASGNPALPLSVTGGLTFAGGPGNNYTTHSVASMVERLRVDGGTGLVTGVGWYLTKHAATVLSARPPAVSGGGATSWSAGESFAVHEVESGGGAEPVGVDAEYRGSAELEIGTVAYDRQGSPEVARVFLRTPSGERTVASSADADVISAVERGDTGLPVVLDSAGHATRRD